MTIKASAALIFAAGLLMGIAGPLPATAAGDNAAASNSESATSQTSVRQGSRSLKKHDTDRRKNTAAKSDDGRKAEEKQVGDAGGGASAALPSSVANANAQMTAADAPPESAKGMSAAMTDKANNVLQAAADKPAETSADSGAVAADQSGPFDRSLTPSEQPVGSATQGVVLASTSRASSDAFASDSSTLDRTSLIGKVFIALGALLTVASAARMFMA